MFSEQECDTFLSTVFDILECGINGIQSEHSPEDVWLQSSDGMTMHLWQLANTPKQTICNECGRQTRPSLEALVQQRTQDNMLAASAPHASSQRLHFILNQDRLQTWITSHCK